MKTNTVFLEVLAPIWAGARTLVGIPALSPASEDAVFNEGKHVEKNKEKQVPEEKKTRVFVFYHHDLDGLTSASLLLLVLKKEKENLEIIFVPFDPNEEFQKIEANEIFIVDIAITPKTWGSLQNLHANTIIWIDHHKKFSEDLKFPENVQLVIDPASPSAVMLVQKYFALNDEISQKIVELGTKADTWVLEPLVQEWMNLDTTYSIKKRDKTPLILALAQGKLEISGRLRRTLNSYLRMKENAKQYLLEHTVVREIDGYTIAIGLAPSKLSGSESADILLKETNSEVQIVLKYQGWMSFRRRKDSTMNLLTIAQLWGGGGHEYAAGGDFGKHVSSRNFKKVAEEIVSKISEVI